MTDIEGKIELKHGSGGLASRWLVEEFILPHLASTHDGKMEDSYVVPCPEGQLSFTVDSFVLSPPELLDVNIGKIAICGTVNDLAMSGATPRWIGLSLVLEEGLQLSFLSRILLSLAETAKDANVFITCGDTKVVEKGAVDKIVVTTSGIGVIPTKQIPLVSTNILPGDKIILTSFLGDHSLHVLSMREGLGFENRVPSDCAPLNSLMHELLKTCGSELRAARDVTRGGFATITNELSVQCGYEFSIQEKRLPIRPETKMGCDMLGIDPLHLANEGCAILFVSAEKADSALEILKGHPYGASAVIVGEVGSSSPAVILENEHEQSILAPLTDQILPRLC